MSAFFPFSRLYLELGLGWFGLGTLLLMAFWYERRVLLAVGVLSAAFESVSEVSYLRDYWHPLTVFAWPTLEDSLYGFGLGIFSATILPFVLRRRLVRTHNARPGVALSLVLAAQVSILLVPHVQAINSIWVACGAFLMFSLVALLWNARLAIPGILTAVIVAVVAALVYGIALNSLVDGRAYLGQTWLLYGHHIGWLVLGNVPFDEIVWNLLRSGFVSAVVLLATGYGFKLYRQPRAAFSND